MHWFLQWFKISDHINTHPIVVHLLPRLRTVSDPRMLQNHTPNPIKTTIKILINFQFDLELIWLVLFCSSRIIENYRKSCRRASEKIREIIKNIIFLLYFRAPEPFQKVAGHPRLLARGFSASGAAWVPSYDHFCHPENFFEHLCLTSISQCFFIINEVFKHFPACWGDPPPRPPVHSHQKFNLSMKK